MQLSELLNKAVERQIISSDQSSKLFDLSTESDLETPTTYAATSSKRVSLDDDEVSRLVGGGNDLFVTIGVLLLLAGGFFAFEAIFGLNITLLYGVSAAAIWLIAEIVTRQRRMKLSSSVLAVAFILCIASILGDWVAGQFASIDPENVFQLIGIRDQIAPVGSALLGGIVLASIIYFWRFRVPVLSAVVGLSATLLVFMFAALYLVDGVVFQEIQISSIEDLLNLISGALYVPLMCGLVVFAIAVMLDLRDRERQTIWSDCAFWLHVLSAPLLVHPLFILATGQNLVVGELEGSSSAGIMLAVLIGVFTFVALAIDRRSLLVPTLAYFGILGVASLIGSTAASTGIPPFALVLLFIGALVIMFGAGWQKIRRLIVAPLLPTSLIYRLPPIKA